ncbi:hypothetical protein [Pontibacter pamirensis]|uniref:hypothetical protein n=1 Tax=Pontibacter pamirensis TaxID=2562824 RepID=UPI00138A5B12|nr:hypothetical protein [Pontibacter pamirensis]
MKKLYLLLPALLFLIFTSCTEEEAPSPPVEQQILGEWQLTNARTDYYDADGIKVHEFGGGGTYTLKFKENEVIVSAYIGTTYVTDSSSYTIAEENGKTFVYIDMAVERPKQEIASISESRLALSTEFGSSTYYDDGKQHTAAKAVSTHEFRKK